MIFREAQSLAYLLPDPAYPGSDHGSGGFFFQFSEKISDFAVLIKSPLAEATAVNMLLDPQVTKGYQLIKEGCEAKRS